MAAIGAPLQKGGKASFVQSTGNIPQNYYTKGKSKFQYAFLKGLRPSYRLPLLRRQAPCFFTRYALLLPFFLLLRRLSVRSMRRCLMRSARFNALVALRQSCPASLSAQRTRSQRLVFHAFSADALLPLSAQRQHSQYEIFFVFFAKRR